MPNDAWKAYAYPLKQITIVVQGRQNSTAADLIEQLDEIKAKLLEGFRTGLHHDDDFGYKFEVSDSEQQSAFGDAPAGMRWNK